MQDPIEEYLKRIVADLNDLGVPYALVGGLAYGARAEPRFTRDIDLTLLAESESIAKDITAALIRCGYIAEMEIAHRQTGALATFRMRYRRALAGIPVDESPFIDLLFSHCGIEKEIIESATITTPFPGLPIPTATIPHLIAMKVLSESDRRLQDRIDVQQLLLAASEAELAQVPALLDLIKQRGFAGDKDLHAVYQRFLEQPA